MIFYIILKKITQTDFGYGFVPKELSDLLPTSTGRKMETKQSWNIKKYRDLFYVDKIPSLESGWYIEYAIILF